jgi:3-oxoacyl-[acyl-carrier-protein] synthase II
MAALIVGSAVRTCLGDGARTFAGLLAGECGARPLRHGDPDLLNVYAGYHIDDGGGRHFLAARLLVEAVADAVAQARLDTSRQRVVALIGTGLRELSVVEEWTRGGDRFPLRHLHFGDAVRRSLPGVADVVTISNACSASGHALALAQDLLDLGEADAVVVGGADAMTESMLAMIGRVAPGRTDRVRPFDRNRQGVLLGDGAAALVLVPEAWSSVDHGPALGRLAGTGISCDAHHQTAPDVEGICRAMRDVFDRTGHDPAAVDLVVAHGTGTELNDPAESEALRKVLVAAGGNPLVTAVKGSVGHTSGGAFLVNVDVGLRCLAGGGVPAVAGLVDPLDEGAGLRFVIGEPAVSRPKLVQVNAFGFGGVNSVSLLEVA